MPLHDESKMSSKQIPMLFFKVKQKHFYSWKTVRILIVSNALQLRLKRKKKREFADAILDLVFLRKSPWSE